jgi:O-antigen ligase
MQLAVLLLLATALFVIAYRLPQLVSSTALLILIPVQPVDTRFASANVLLTFVIFIAMLMKGEKVRLPLLPQFLLLLFCYLLSMSFVHKALYVQHAVYMVAVVSAYMVLCIAYDLTLRFRSLNQIVNVFFVMNLIVIVYCLIQMSFGPGVGIRVFGLEQMAMIPARDDNRLTGPFRAVGVTAEFFVIMIFLILHRILISGNVQWRRSLAILGAVNLGMLVATGNRGGFIVLLGAMIMFLWLFRKELGMRKVVQLVTGGTVALAIAATLIVSYTDFGRLFERLESTTVEEGIPDTRQHTWPLAWEKIKQRPLLGHGPRFEMDGAAKGTEYPGHEHQPYPHSLYLFLLVTIGVVGLIAFLIFLITPLVRCWRVSRKLGTGNREGVFARLGFLIFSVILVDQIKVEFMRIGLVDYWHFVFALLGVFAAVCDRARLSATAVPANQPGRAEARYRFSPQPVERMRRT